jgi:hypothetical protein
VEVVDMNEYGYQVLFHVKRGPVIVNEQAFIGAMKGKDIMEACKFLSERTPRYVDYYPSVSRRAQGRVLLRMEDE